MPALRTTRQLLEAYAEQETWVRDHEQAQSCLEIEEKLAWGQPIFRGLVELEARLQMQAIEKATPETTLLILEVMPTLYRNWLVASERYLKKARQFVDQGFGIDGLEAFDGTVEEARTLCENLALEDQIRPIEDLMEHARHENPRPDRYGH